MPTILLNYVNSEALGYLSKGYLPIAFNATLTIRIFSSSVNRHFPWNIEFVHIIMVFENNNSNR